MSRNACVFPLLLAILSLFATIPLFADWQHLPVDHPYLTAFVADSSGQRLYCGMSSAGLWLSENGGQSWTPISDRFAQDAVRVKSLWVHDPGADTVMGLFYPRASLIPHQFAGRSLEGGQTWEELPSLGIRTQRLQTSHIAPCVWFALEGSYYPEGDRLRLLCSNDCGSTWPDTLLFRDGLLLSSDILTNENFVSVLFLLTSEDYDHSVILRSFDFGTHWAEILSTDSLGGIQSGEMAWLTNGELFFVGNQDSTLVMLRSQNSGTDWTVESTLPLSCFVRSIMEDASHPGTLLMRITGDFAGLWRSNDYGHTWEMATLPQDLSDDYCIYANQHGGNIWIFSSDGQLYRSSDRGDTWSSVNVPPVGSDAYMTIVPLEQAIFAEDYFSC